MQYKNYGLRYIKQFNKPEREREKNPTLLSFLVPFCSNAYY